MKNGTGTDIEISETQIRKVGGNIFSLASKFLPKVIPAVSKIGGPFLTGALAGLGENIIDKIFGKKGGMIIPMKKLTQMGSMLNLLTEKQKRVLHNAYQTGGNMYLRPTKKTNATRWFLRCSCFNWHTISNEFTTKIIW